MFGEFICLLMCKSVSGMNSEDFPLVCISGLCLGPHPKAGRFLQSPLLQKHHLGLTEGRGAVSLWNVVRDQPGQEQLLQMLVLAGSV